jgi:transposase-like protein
MPPKEPNPIRRRDFNREKREEAVRLYLDAGLTQEEIGEEIGVSRGRVGQYLRQMGVKQRYQFRKSARYRESLEVLKAYVGPGANVDDLHAFLRDFYET